MRLKKRLIDNGLTDLPSNANGAYVANYIMTKKNTVI
jgi:hypothetical protein